MQSSPCRELRVLVCSPGEEEGFWHLYLEAPGWRYRPGQFVMVRPMGWDLDPIWPRPFSICECDENGLHLFFQVVGRGTQKMAGLQPGEKVVVWGPLGRGFNDKGDKPVLVLAGGMGIAPFVGYIKNHPKPGQLELLFGHRPDLANYPYEELDVRVRSRAMQQQTPEEIQEFVGVLDETIGRYGQGRGRVFACGPTPFLKAVQKISNEHRAEAYISLENHMACGIGACLGCVCKTPEGELVQTCTKGPVFHVSEVDLGGN
jgi:dihydroorotate dehydrogenase electron transfer subunit